MTEYPDRPGYSFDPGPPPEASRFLKNKGLRPSFGYEDVEPEEHAVAFAVAKMGEIDLLEAARAEVQKALDEGLPFEAFQKSWRNNPKLTEWWGKKEMVDPLTGELAKAQLGSPRRLKTIYRANLASARAAGQWARIERTKAMLPFLEYRLGPSERHRPHHEAKAGMILPVDSPFWDEWMPPNGWGCKCWVRQLTRREAERRGIATTPDIPDMKYRNPRTGSVAIVPQGIDPGWQRNPGKLRLEAVEGMLKDRLEAAPEAVQLAALRDIANSWRVERMLAGGSKGFAPIAVLTTELAAALGSQARIVSIRDDIAAKLRERHPEVTGQELTRFAEAIMSGRAAMEMVSGRPVLQIFTSGDQPWRMVIKVIADKGELWISTVHRARPGQWQDVAGRDGVTVLRD
jgi:hypothetical protein